MNVSEKQFKKEFIKECGKKKFTGSSLIPKGMKNWGCKKAADKAWKNFQKNGPEKKEKKDILSKPKKEKKGILGKIKLRW